MSKQPSAPQRGDNPPPTAPRPPPAWRHWLWPIALIATVALYILLPGINNTNTVTLTYSKFIATASQHQIKDVTCSSSSNGGNTSASGTLTNGKSYTTVIPGAPSTQLANQLRADGVKSVTASANSPGLGSELLYWLVLLAPLVFVIWLFRRMSRGATGALQGALGVGRSRAKVFDAERPSTKFSDLAGYESASRRSTSCCRRWTASTWPRALSSWRQPTVPRCSTQRCCGLAGLTGRSPSRCRRWTSGPRSWPYTAGTRSSRPTSICGSWPGERPDSPAPTWPTSPTRRRSSPSVATAKRSPRPTSTTRGTGSCSVGGRDLMSCCPTRSTRSRCTRQVTRWWPPCPSTPIPSPRSPSCRPARRLASLSSCR